MTNLEKQWTRAEPERSVDSEEQLRSISGYSTSKRPTKKLQETGSKTDVPDLQPAGVYDVDEEDPPELVNTALPKTPLGAQVGENFFGDDVAVFQRHTI